MAGGTTIVDRLNKLSGKDATTIAKALENLEEGGGSGSPLPSPTTADNGKVLGVDGGEYALVDSGSIRLRKIALSGGGTAFVKKDGEFVTIQFNDAVYTTASVAKVPLQEDERPVNAARSVTTDWGVIFYRETTGYTATPLVTSIVRNGEDTWGIDVRGSIFETGKTYLINGSFTYKVGE